MGEFSDLRQKNLLLAKKLVRESVSPDLFIINSINNIEDLQKIENTLSKRLREWYSLYFPEADKKISDHKEFANFVITESKESKIKEWQIEQTMGADLEEKELDEIRVLAKSILDLFDEEKRLVEYLEKTMKELCPNTMAIATPLIGAKLLRGAGSLRKLAMMRSSTIQLIGAEKALFRHIRTGARPPKYGYLINHPLVQRAPMKIKGKIARTIADKAFIAAKLDYFKGEYMADELLKQIEEKLK